MRTLYSNNIIIRIFSHTLTKILKNLKKYIHFLSSIGQLKKSLFK